MLAQSTGRHGDISCLKTVKPCPDFRNQRPWNISHNAASLWLLLSTKYDYYYFYRLREEGIIAGYLHSYIQLLVREELGVVITTRESVIARKLCACHVPIYWSNIVRYDASL